MAAAPLWRRVVCAVLLPAALVRAARPSGKCGADAIPTKVPSSIAISPPFERDLPVCYASEPHGLGALSGNWRTDDSPEPPYWNLSCPFEWAKYSCVHQGNAGHAARARMRFEPAGCAMLSVDGRQLARALRPNQRLMLIGDSHIRQVRGREFCILNSRERACARARLRESAPARAALIPSVSRCTSLWDACCIPRFARCTCRGGRKISRATAPRTASRRGRTRGSTRRVVSS